MIIGNAATTIIIIHNNYYYYLLYNVMISYENKNIFLIVNKYYIKYKY